VPKIHKPGHTFRIIILSIDSPTHSLAIYLHKTITKNIDKSFGYIENSYQLVKKLNGLHLATDKFDYVSLDVISLFANVPTNIALESISNRWSQIYRGTKIPKSEFLNAIKIILDSTFFKFNNKIYKQNFGTPMGSPLSPIIADIVMQDLEKKALEGLKKEIPFYYRYVDDILTAIPRQRTTELLDSFNSLHPRMQFTIEIGGNRLNFLDATIINNNILEFN